MKRVHEITLSAVFTAMICAIAVLSVLTPLGVPLSLQTFAVALCGYSLNTRQSLFSVATYILLGLVGLPVFTGFTGGPQVLLGICGGFIVGFLPLVFFCSVAHGKKAVLELFCGMLGLIACYLLGVIWISVISGKAAAYSFVVGALPFIIKDILSVIGAFFIGKFLRKRLEKSF